MRWWTTSGHRPRFEAMCDECGQIDEDHVPFSEPWPDGEIEQGEQERSDE